MIARGMAAVAALALGLNAPTARAADQERLERALRTVNKHVYVLEDTTERKLQAYGSVAAVLGVTLAVVAGVGVVAVKPPLPRWAYAFVGVPAATAVGGIGTAWVGQWRRRNHPTPPPPVQPPAHYQSPEGLRDFVRLGADQQRRLAEANPDFAAFLIEISEARQRVLDAEFLPGGTP